MARFAGRRACRWEYRRDGQGELTREVAYDRAGTVVWTFHFATRTTGYFTDQRGFPRPRAGSGAAFVSFVYTRDGLARELRYLGPTQQPRSDRDGIFGQRREFDGRGLITAVSFLGSGDQPVLHPDGYAKEVREHDTEGNRTAGPPVRGLDRYQFSIRNGRLVLGPIYSVSRVDGAGSAARIHSVKRLGDGEPATGPESLLYPVDPIS